jgi:hypothetical protein
MPLSFLGVRPAGSPAYLGDGAYAVFDGHQIWLRANHHSRNLCTGEIALEPGALAAFIRFAARYWKLSELLGEEE